LIRLPEPQSHLSHLSHHNRSNCSSSFWHINSHNIILIKTDFLARVVWDKTETSGTGLGLGLGLHETSRIPTTNPIAMLLAITHLIN